MGYRDAIADPWGHAYPVRSGRCLADPGGPALVEGVAVDEVERWVRMASLLHSKGDAMDVAVRGGRIVGVRGRAEDRVNRGRLGPKDLFGGRPTRRPIG